MLEELDSFVTEYPKKKLGQAMSKDMTSIKGAKEDIAVENLGIEDKFFAKLTELGINLDELKAVLLERNNALINSCAGSGKTTALVLKIIFDLVRGDNLKEVKLPDKVAPDGSIIKGSAYKVPKKILVSTFLKTGAEEIKKAFNDWCRKLGLKGISADILTVKTMHAEFYDVIKQIYGSVNLVSDTSKYVRQIMQERNIRSRTAYSRTLTLDEVKDIECIMTYARNRLDAAKYKHPLMTDYGLTESTLNLILSDFAVKKQNAGGELDYEDLQELLYKGVQVNANLKNFLANRYEVIYLDEFQDTAQLQYELLKCYFDGADKIVVVGDEDQCIYSWRGSDVNIITQTFENEYKPTVLTLSTNYRCSRNILMPVTTSIVKNSNRHAKVLKAAKPGGEVNIVYSKNPDILLQSIYKDLAERKSIGIISRTNYDLLIPAIILELSGDIKFAASKMVTLEGRLSRQVCGIIDLVTKRYTPEFDNYFSSFLSKYTQYEAETLCQMLSANPMMTIYTIPKEDLEYSVPNLAPFITTLKTVKEAQGEVAAYIYILDTLINDVYISDSQYATRARDLCLFVKTLINESEIFKGKSVNEVDRILNDVLPRRLKDRTTYNTDVDIKLTTVHEAKGKEWDSVYLWNDVDGAFPASVGRRPLTALEFEEERRIHYIAWTRPKEKLTVFTSRGMESPFLQECTMGEGCKIDKGIIAKVADDNTEDIAEQTGVLQLNKDVVIKTNKLENESLKDFANRYVLDRYSADSEYGDKVRAMLMKKPLNSLIEQLMEQLNILIKEDGVVETDLTFVDVDDALTMIV